MLYQNYKALFSHLKLCYQKMSKVKWKIKTVLDAQYNSSFLKYICVLNIFLDIAVTYVF